MSINKNPELTETKLESEGKKKRVYKISEEDREKRRQRGKELALKKAEKIKENKEKKKKQVTYKDYVNVVNDLVSSGTEDSGDEEVEVPQEKPVIKVGESKKKKIAPKPEKVQLTETSKVINPPEPEKPKEKTTSDIMLERIMASGKYR